MAQKKQFCPHIYADWGELFEILTVEQKAEILIAITKFPNYEPKDVPIWNFIKSQLQKDYEIFVEKCQKNSKIARNYWGNKNNSQDNSDNAEETTNNELQKQSTKTKTKTKTTDPFFNPLKETFAKEYKKIFNQEVYLGREDLFRLAELTNTYADIKNLIPLALSRLKNISFKDINFKPTANWLLKENNFERVLNGEFEACANKEEIKPDKAKLLELTQQASEERQKNEQRRIY